MKSSKHSRRRFLRTLAAAPTALWALAGRDAFAASPEAGRAASVSPPSRARIVVATRASAADSDGRPNRNEVARLLNDSLTAFTGKADVSAAWRSLFVPGDVVGIKANCLGGRGLSSHPELVAAVVHGLSLAGVPKERILVWDRSEHELSAAGFDTSGVAGARVIATDSRGAGYERDIEFSGAVGSCFSTILSRTCTAIVNVPVLKDHDLSGVSLGMKNFYGAIHNPNKYHDNNCNPYIADLNAHPFIAGKLRLVVCDGLKGQYHGGPALRPQWAWPAATLVVGTDPVAVDRVGMELIERKRREAGMNSLKDAGRDPAYIEAAASRGLGVADPGKIERTLVS
jgi:uncharacterized protein (DUF362 family)